MRPALEYIGGSTYYENQARECGGSPEAQVYATLAQQQATLAVAAAISEQTDAIREAAETGVRVVND